MIVFFSIMQSGFSQGSFQLPWEREIPLKEAAKTVFLTSTLDSLSSLPNRKCYPHDGKAMTINNLKMRTTLCGFYDLYRQPHKYSMPCLKPVGQIIEGIKKLGKVAEVTTLWHTDPAAENSLDNPGEVVPQNFEFQVKDVSIEYTLSPNSLTVIRI